MDTVSFLEYSTWLVLLFTFLAGFVDAIAGGGGLISIPVLMMAFPMAAMPNIIGTNRFSSFLGTLTAAWQYNKNHKANLQILLFAGVPAALMAAIGAWCSHFIPSDYFKPIVIVILLLVIIFSLFKKKFGHESLPHKKDNVLILALCFGTIIGFYNGLIGPGTGTFLLFSLVTFLGFNLIQASATAKFLNVIVDVSSLFYFLLAGSVVFKLAIPMAACNMLGGYIGSKIAIAKGNQFIRYFFLLIAFCLVVKLIINYYNLIQYF